MYSALGSEKGKGPVGVKAKNCRFSAVLLLVLQANHSDAKHLDARNLCMNLLY